MGGTGKGERGKIKRAEKSGFERLISGRVYKVAA